MQIKTIRTLSLRGIALSASLAVSAFGTSVFTAPASALAGPPADANVATATQLGAAFTSVADRVSPSVVSIQVETAVQQRGFGFFSAPPSEGYATGGGSGVIIRSDGYVLTNHHVVNGARRIDVHLNDGRRFPARVVGTDPATDLAVLHIDAKGLPAARFADSDRARVGEWVVAIGSPFGLDYTVTTGVLSAKGRGGLGANEIEDYLQTDASINPGNSGGPLVTLQGEVLGINTMIIGRASGIGFAIPSNLARQVADQLRTSGEVHRAWIGVGYQELTPELASQFGAKRYRGALINQVVPGGPAHQAGVRPGDIVLSVAGNEVREGRDLLRLILRHPVGERISLEVLRRGKRRTLSLVTGERPGREASAQRTPQAGKKPGQRNASRVGLSLARLTPSLARQLHYDGPGGVVVARVQPGSPADRAGVARGDVVEEVNRKTVSDPRDVVRALSREDRALLTLRRHGGTFFAVLKR